MSNNKTNTGKKFLITICAILAVVLVVGLAVFNKVSESGILTRNKIAMESENFEVDGMMMNYFISSTAQPYSQYFSLLGVDTTKSLKDQMYSDEQSWFDYFADSASTYVGEVLTLCEYAKANGIELGETEFASIDADLEEFKHTAENAGYSLETYLYLVFGSGMKVDDVKNCLKLTTLADLAYTAYAESTEYTEEELLAYREANPDSFKGVDYIAYTLKASDFTVFENSTSVSTDEEDIAALEAAADKLNKAQTVEEFKSILVELFAANHTDHEGHDESEFVQAAEDAYIRHSLKTDLGEDVATWAFAAKVGETKLVKNEAGDEITVYMLAKTAYIDETVTRNVRHILFSSNTYKDDTKVKEAYAEWEAENFSDEKFIALEYLYNEDEGSKETAGVYENLAIGTTDKAFDAWLYNADRKVGDREIVETSFGWHIMEYLGEGDNVAWYANAKEFKASDDYQAFIKAGQEKVTTYENVINGLDY